MVFINAGFLQIAQKAQASPTLGSAVMVFINNRLHKLHRRLRGDGFYQHRIFADCTEGSAVMVFINTG